MFFSGILYAVERKEIESQIDEAVKKTIDNVCTMQDMTFSAIIVTMFWLYNFTFSVKF